MSYVMAACLVVLVVLILAWIWQGFECAWQVEIDDYCRQILDKHWPRVPKYKDIYESKEKRLSQLTFYAEDSLVSQSPLQESVVELMMKGGSGTSSTGLFASLGPRWVVAENVTGLFSANSGRAFAGVLRNLAESGYDAVWDVYPAGGPGGVGAPHRRERVFLVAHTDRSKQAKKSGDVREVSGVSEVNRQDISTVVSGGSSEDVANTDKKRLQRSKETRDVEGKGQDGQKYIARCNKGAEQWAVEPNVGRVANGFPIGWTDLKHSETQSSPKSHTK